MPAKKNAKKQPDATASERTLNRLGAARPGAETGSSGTALYGGSLYVEYNQRLAGQNGLRVYEQMRKSDAQVAATLHVIGLPIRATRWYVEPGKAEGADGEQEVSAFDREVAEFVEKSLLRDMEPGWDAFLRQALTMLPFGFSLFEKVYAVENGRVTVKKLAQRLATSVWRWHYKADGTPDVTQQITMSDDGKPSNIFLPGDKLVLFTFGREGDNYEGVSVLRPAYKHWYIKDNLYKLDSVKHERQAVGIPVITMPAAHTDKDAQEAELILSNLRSTEKNYVVLPSPDWKFEYAKIGGSDTATNVKDSVEHHNREIAKNVLAQFMELGAAGSGGSYSLSEDQSSIFTLSLTAIARQIADTVNKYVVRELVDANFDMPEGASYPTLCFQKLGEVSYTDVATAISTLASAGAVTPDTDLEDHLRKVMDLPKRRMEEDGSGEPADGEEDGAAMDSEASAADGDEDESADARAEADPESEAASADAELAALEKAASDLEASELSARVGPARLSFSDDAEADAAAFRAPVDDATKAKISEALKKWWAAHGRKSPDDLAAQRSKGRADAEKASADLAKRTEEYRAAVAPLKEKLAALKKEAGSIPFNKRTPKQRKALRAAASALRSEIAKLRDGRDADAQALRTFRKEALASAKAAQSEARVRTKAVEGAIAKAREDVKAKNATRSEAIRSLAAKVRANAEASASAYAAARSMSGAAKKEAVKNAKALSASIRKDNAVLREAARKLREEARAEKDAFLAKADAVRRAAGTARSSSMSEDDARALGFSDPAEMRAFLDSKAVFDPAVILSAQRHG